MFNHSSKKKTLVNDGKKLHKSSCYQNFLVLFDFAWLIYFVSYFIYKSKLSKNDFFIKYEQNHRKLGNLSVFSIKLLSIFIKLLNLLYKRSSFFQSTCLNFPILLSKYLKNLPSFSRYSKISHLKLLQEVKILAKFSLGFRFWWQKSRVSIHRINAT